MVRPLNTSLYSIKAIIILDSEGKRVLSKFFSKDFPTAKEQRTFENNIFEKTKRAPAGEILMYEGLIICYKNNVDLFFYVVGSADENELILSAFLTSLYDTTALLLKNQVEKRIVLENIDAMLLILDELVDNGIILESDPTNVAQRVSMKNLDGQDVPLAEQTLSQAFATARQQLTRSLLN